MIQIRKSDGTWTEFYPVIGLDLAGEGDLISPYKLSNLPDRIYGKYEGGVAGYQVWWEYITVAKASLREV